MKKFLFLLIVCFSIITLTNEVEAQYGSHITEPFEMNHHITSYLDTNTGYLYLAGDNRYYNLGDGTTTQSNYYFASYKNGDANDKFINPIDWDFEIYHSAVIDSDGTLWTTGNGTSGMLGNGSTTSSTVFKQVSLPNNLKATKVIASRGSCTLVLLEDGNLYGVGSSSTVGVTNNYQFTQMNNKLPIGDQDVVEFQGGDTATLLLTSKGNLYTIGSSNGCGGSGSWDTPKLTNVVQIDLMYQSAYALKNDGTVWCSGSNSDKQFGFTGSASTYTQSPLSLEDGEFVTSVKGGIGTGYIQTNKGNLYVTGTNSQGQYGDGTKISCSVFTKKHTDVAFFDVGEYQTGVLFKDSSLKFFGYNNFGQLGIGNTNTVIDATSPEADLIAPEDDNTGVGLTPAVSLPIYEPDISIWPSEKVEELTQDEIDEATTSTTPIQPGEAFDDGSSNIFVDDNGKVYILSAPAIKSSTEITSTIEFDNNDFLRVNYQNIDFSSGVLEGYKLKITIEGDNSDYRNSFFYGTDQDLESSYPKAVGKYIVTSTLLNTRYETKTTIESYFEIVESTYLPTANNINEYLNNTSIITGVNTVTRLKEDILNGIKYEDFLLGDFTEVEGTTRQYYIDGDFSNLNFNHVNISFGTTQSSSSLSDITTPGDYYCRINVSPDNYKSETLYIKFTIDGVITPEGEFTHNTPIVPSSIDFNTPYNISINNTTISSSQKHILSFIDSNNKFITSFEATEENIANFDLYPKNSGTYQVISTIKDSNDNTLSVKYSSTYKINTLSTSQVFQPQELIDKAVDNISANGTYRIDDDIKESINSYLSDYLSLNDVYIVDELNIVLLTKDNYKNYLEVSFYTSKGYSINEINYNGDYFISYSLLIPNYILDEDTTKYPFTIDQTIELVDNCVTINNLNAIDFATSYTLEINTNSLEILNEDIYELTVIISNETFKYEYIYNNCNIDYLPKEVGTYLVTVKTKHISSNVYYDDVYTTIYINEINTKIIYSNSTSNYIQVNSIEEITTHLETLIETQVLSLSSDLYKIQNNKLTYVKLDLSHFEITYYNTNKEEVEITQNGDYCLGIRFIGYTNYKITEILYLNLTLGEYTNFKDNCAYFLYNNKLTKILDFTDFNESTTFELVLDEEELFFESKYNVTLVLLNTTTKEQYEIDYIVEGVKSNSSDLNTLLPKTPGLYLVSIYLSDDTEKDYSPILSSLEIKKGELSLNGIDEDIIKETLSNIYTNNNDLKEDITIKLNSLITTTIKTDHNTYIVNNNAIELSPITNFSYIFSPNEVKDIGVYTVEIYFEENSYYKKAYSIPFEFKINGIEIKDNTATFVYGNNFEISTTAFEFSKFNVYEYLIDLGEEFDKYLNNNYEVTVYITNEDDFNSIIENYVPPILGGEFYDKMPYKAGAYIITIKVYDNLSNTYFKDSISYLTIENVKAVISAETKDTNFILKDNLYDIVINTYLSETKLFVNNQEINNFVIYNNGFDTKEITYDITIFDENNNEVTSLEEGTYKIIISASCENYEIDSIQYEIIVTSSTPSYTIFVISSIIFIMVISFICIAFKFKRN